MPSSTNTPLFTIGHSTHSQEAFLGLLARHGIAAIIEVRSQPFSRRFPQFNRERLTQALAENGIEYYFLGEELGARRREEEVYIDGRADYGRIAELPLFQQGLNRVRELASVRRPALLCAEKEPLDCHRTILVCRHLRSELPIAHILADGTLEDHADTEARLMKKMKVERGLFDSPSTALDEAYDRRALQINYTRDT